MLKLPAISNVADKKKVFAIAFVVIAILLVAVGIGAGFFVKQRSAFDYLLNQTIREVEKTESVLVQMNEVLSDPLGDSARKEIGEVQRSLPDVIKSLETVQASADYLSTIVTDSEGKKAVAQLKRTIEGRKTMAESGSQLLEHLALAEIALDGVEGLRDSLTRSDESARSASALVSDPTTDNLSKAITLLNESIYYLNIASSQVNTSIQGYPQADFSTVENYISLRVEAYQAEIGALSALKSGDTDTARSYQNQYDEKDAQARELRASFSDVAAPIIAAYDSEVRELVDRYTYARNQVASADEYLRAYRGQDSK